MTIAEATAAAPPRSDIAEVPVPTASAIDIAEAVATASAIDIAEANDDDECTDTCFQLVMTAAAMTTTSMMRMTRQTEIIMTIAILRPPTGQRIQCTC